jgi:hypothetical protein
MSRRKRRNWQQYNRNLVQRGSLTLWIERASLDWWRKPQEQQGIGHPFVYSTQAIVLLATLRIVFHLSLRQLQGFVDSLFIWAGIALQSPCYTQICRRINALHHSQLPRISNRRPQTIILDSTGLKIYGEGEWKRRVHGASKRRQWVKIHVGIDPRSGEVVIHQLTGPNAHDGVVGHTMLDALKKGTRRLLADGAYDCLHFRRKLYERGISTGIPPPRNARIHSQPWHAERNLAILTIRGLGGDGRARSLWGRLTGYSQRSLVETFMSRWKTVLSPSLRSRSLSSQLVEVHLGCWALNRMLNAERLVAEAP